MKKLIAAILALTLLAVPAQALAETKVPAETKSTLSYEKARAVLDVNSSTLNKLKDAQSDALENYRLTVLEWADKDINGMTKIIGDREVYITFSADTRNSLNRLKQLLPEQMKFAWESARDNLLVTTESLNDSLRNVFLGAWSAQSDVTLKQKSLELAQEIDRQNALKYKSGMLTSVDLEESAYNVEKAQKALDASKRSLENAVRNLNLFIGLPYATAWAQLTYDEKWKAPALKLVDEYVASALNSRLDVVSVQKQLELKELDKRLTDVGAAYNTSTTAQEAYEVLLNEIEGLKLDLEAAKLAVTDEIRNAYVDVVNAGKSLQSLDASLKLQRSNVEKLKARYSAGLITKTVLTQAEVGLLQAENGWRLKLYDYNTKLLRFYDAAGIGPGY